MNASEILALFRRRVDEPEIEQMFSVLGTYRRPSIDPEGDGRFHDWVLIKRKGLELGFTDSEYHNAASRAAWGRGHLLFTQAYFYSMLENGQPYGDALPFGLEFTDHRVAVRAKLLAHEQTRHSHLSDTWDTDNHRLTVAYGDDGLVDKVVCRVTPAPITGQDLPNAPPLAAVVEAFGDSISSIGFQQLWGVWLDRQAHQQAHEDGEIDFTQSFGATLGLSGDREPVFRSIVLHRNRDLESVGWSGELPQQITFEDSPETLLTKMGPPDTKGADSVLTGYAVWHFQELSVHVLYSNVDNRILRVKLMAPGTWKSVRDV